MKGPLLVIGLFFFVACTQSADDLWKDHLQAKMKNNPDEAVHALQKFLAKAEKDEQFEDAHTQLGELYQFGVGDYKQSLNHYTKALSYSVSPKNRHELQTKIAELVFEKINDHARSIVEYSRLIQIEEDHRKKENYKLRIAKSHYHEAHLYQAYDEAEQILSDSKDNSVRFEAKLLQANIRLAEKKLAKAAEVYESLLQEFPEKAKAEKIGLNLAMTYEELNDFDKALKTLERLKSHYSNPEYLQIRIDRIKKRQLSRPGAKGLRK